MIIKDAVIPFHPKDIPTLQMCCDSLKNVLNVERIFLISSENPNIAETNFINEKEITNLISLNEISEIWKYHNPNIAYRSGWIYQQILELGAPDIIPDISEDYIVCDSDIVFLKNPYINAPNDMFPFDRAFTGEYHHPYIDHYQRMMQEPAKAGISFINHHMVTNKSLLAELKKMIEIKNNKRWDWAIVENLNFNEASAFASDDLYGNWAVAYHPNKMINVPLKILDVFKIPSSDDLINLKNQGYDIVSSQAYKRA